MKKDGLDERAAGSRTGWTRVDDYLVALARRRTARHKREGRQRSRMDEDGPTPTLGTIPFLIIMAAFAVLVIAIAGLAWPQKHDHPKAAGHEMGTAPAGWFEKAKREMNEAR